MDFAKATKLTGVNGGLALSHPDVFMRRDAIPAFDTEAAWYQCLEVAQTVRLARGDKYLDDCNDELRNFIALGDSFQTDALAAVGVHTVRDGALFVQMDNPWDLFMQLDEYLMGRTDPVFDFKPANGINFINGATNFWAEVGVCAMRVALNQAFGFKWEQMIARPEERVAAVLAGKLAAPDWFERELRQEVFVDAVLSDPRKFTIYDEGCPLHPSYPAGHGAAAGATYALLTLKYGLNKKSKLHDDIGQTCLSFAHCRTLAGVHYAQDNLQGFRLGVMTIKQGIVDLLKTARLPESDIAEVAEASRDIPLEWVK